MPTDAFIKVTFAAHKLVSMLPPEEDLRAVMLECADAILADLILLWQEEIVSAEHRLKIGSLLFGKIDTLRGYFSRVQSRNWVDSKNFLMIEDQYSKIKKLVEEKMNAAAATKVREESPETSHEMANTEPADRAAATPKETRVGILSNRQSRIIELLKNKERIQVWELQKIMPQVTKRTLRRDLDDLMEQNLIERLGEWNSISYRIRA